MRTFARNEMSPSNSAWGFMGVKAEAKSRKGLAGLALPTPGIAPPILGC